MTAVIDETHRACRPLAATTTWERFPTLWKEMLDQVWAFLRDHVVPSSLPGGRVARTVHRGPYDRLSEPHRASASGARHAAWYSPDLAGRSTATSGRTRPRLR